MSKPCTIKDVAAYVGVSNMTVSAVLGNSTSGHVRVSEATRVRVLAAARHLDYRPNRLARSLRGQKSNVIGVYAAYGYLNPQAMLTAQILGGLHQGCDRHRKDLLLHGSYQDRSTEEIYAELADRRVDGLVLYTAPADPLVARLASSDLPVVAIVDAVTGLPSVVADDAGGAGLLASYLARLGHRHVFYRPGGLALVSAVRRQRAFLAAAAESGLRVTVGPSPPDPEWHERITDSELEWLRRPRESRPTVAVCWNDLTAYFLIEQCRRRGLRLPQDLAVVGFDDIPPPHSTPGRLTTVRAPWVDVASMAVDLLVRRLAGDDIPAETVLPVMLVIGDTT